MAQKISLNVPLNRVEGDLELRVEIEDGVVTEAWSTGTMFRGIENMLVGRSALDSLIITPRVCGICTTSHLAAACQALDMVAGVTPPPAAIRLRNIALAIEHIQSDVRHGFLMFTADFVNPAYQNSELYAEAVRRYEPLKGSTVIKVLKETKKILEIVAIIGGQWPHSSYMVPGGVVSSPLAADVLDSRLILRQYGMWYEQQILGCSIARWSEVTSLAELDAWLEEKREHRESELGFYINFCRQNGLDKMGRGHGNFISYGGLPLPADTRVKGYGDDGLFIPAGFVTDGQVSKLNQLKIEEHVAYSWYKDYPGGKHPFSGETKPYAVGQESQKYSWAKAPRYNGLPAETGPLAEMIIARHPLFVDMIKANGPSVFSRELARLVRPAILIPAITTWLEEYDPKAPRYNSPGQITEGHGHGLAYASRGALGHWVRVENGKIMHYQIITPTAWHASPRDSHHVRGVFEQALIGTPVKDPENPVELGHVVRSFDACLVCTVHAISKGKHYQTITLG